MSGEKKQQVCIGSRKFFPTPKNTKECVLFKTFAENFLSRPSGYFPSFFKMQRSFVFQVFPRCREVFQDFPRCREFYEIFHAGSLIFLCFIKNYPAFYSCAYKMSRHFQLGCTNHIKQNNCSKVTQQQRPKLGVH